MEGHLLFRVVSFFFLDLFLRERGGGREHESEQGRGRERPKQTPSLQGAQRGARPRDPELMP